MSDAAAPVVRIADGPTNLAALLMARLLGRGAVRQPDRLRRMQSRRLRIWAGSMPVTLTGSPTGIDVSTDAEGPVDATLSGDLGALLAAARGGLAGAILTGRLGLRGKVWCLLDLAALMRPPSADAGASGP